MPKYDYSLSDFLKYASTQNQEFFPLSERIEITKRICDGLLYMNKMMCTPHRDIKSRSVHQILLLQKRINLVEKGVSVNNINVDNFEKHSK